MRWRIEHRGVRVEPAADRARHRDGDALVPPASVRVPLTTGDVAGLLGIDLSHACRVLRAMKRDGLVEVSRGWIVLPDVSRLLARRAAPDEHAW